MIGPGLWAALGSASMLAGFVRGVTGFGGALTLTPFIVVLLGPLESVPLVMVIHAVTGLVDWKQWRHAAHWARVLPFTVAGIVATTIFSALLADTTPGTLKRITGAVIALLALVQLAGRQWKHGGGRIPTSVAAAASGFCAAVAGTPGPPAVLYFTGLGEAESQSARANLLAYFALLYTAGACVLAMQGRLPRPLGVQALLLSPFFYVGTLAGTKVFHRIGTRRFNQVVAVLLVVSGFVMLAGR